MNWIDKPIVPTTRPKRPPPLRERGRFISKVRAAEISNEEAELRATRRVAQRRANEARATSRCVAFVTDLSGNLSRTIGG